MILLKGGDYLSPDGIFKKGSILLEGEAIRSVEDSIVPHEGDQVHDITGMKVIPGLIDIHSHGAVGIDVMSAEPEDLLKLTNFLAQNGTTSFLPTTITSTWEELRSALPKIQKAALLPAQGASIEGIHIEGPYINPLRKGCHEPKNMRSPSSNDYDELRSLAAGLKLHFTVAPEIRNGLAFIAQVSAGGGSVSIGHSEADFETTMKALQSGALAFTHLFNAMKGIHHREPGVAGAALCSNAYVELVCDGVHIHPEIVKLVYKVKGSDRLILVSDAMQATGLGDGEYQFGGQRVTVQNGIARNSDGSLASSTLTVFAAVKKMMALTGVSLENAVRMASFNPARLLGIDNIVGSIEKGKRADLLVLDDRLNLVTVFCKGRRLV
jgi:N-acetylglucosamine-6-phosphate deacetylase